jgi:Cytochrome c
VRHRYFTNPAQKGLSMLEMMFAMVVLFLVGAFVMNMFVTGSHQLVRAGKKEKISGFLRAKTSELRLLEYAQLDPLSATGNFGPADPDYLYRIDYSAFESYALSEARVVEVTVSHPEIGEIKNRLVRSAVPPLSPGQAAFNKFGCASCHSLTSAGYAAGPTLVPLDQIGVSGNPRPYQSGSGTLEDYINNSLTDPGGFDAYPDVTPAVGFSNLVMTYIPVEGSDPAYDPATGVSSQEMSDLTEWIAGFNTP